MRLLFLHLRRIEARFDAHGAANKPLYSRLEGLAPVSVESGPPVRASCRGALLAGTARGPDEGAWLSLADGSGIANADRRRAEIERDRRREIGPRSGPLLDCPPPWNRYWRTDAGRSPCRGRRRDDARCDTALRK